MKLNAIGLFVENLEVMRIFYNKVMKMKQNIHMEGFVGFETEGGFFFNLCDKKWMSEEETPPYVYSKGISGKMELSFGVDTFEEVDKEYKRLVEVGATPFIAPNTKPYGSREAYVADPEGNLIEIVSFK